MQAGQLIDDQIVVDVVRNLHENREEFMGGKFSDVPGIILDGVPRTVNQAEKLHQFMDVDVVINFLHREEMVLAKILGRRVCPVCNKNFNIAHIQTDYGYVLPPLLPKGPDPTICDNEEHETPVKLITREDDTEEIVRNRLAIYDKETLPILNFYKTFTDTTVIDYEAKYGVSDFPEFQ